MQKKNDRFLEKIVKKDYNNELEKVLEKKYFEETVKSTLLSILYRIETSYKDYKQVKRNVETKEDFLENMIQIIEKDCDEIKLVKPHSEESKIIGDRTFLVEKNKKRIICYHVERKLLYAIAKIAKNDKIIKENYFLIDKTLSNLIQVGNCINMVEPLRDFNGYSWTTIPVEMESVDHNLIYQNLILLVGYPFLNNWIRNKEVVLDYLELFQNRMEENYGEKNAKQWIEALKKISILLEAKFDKKSKEEMLRTKKKVEEKLEAIQNNQEFIEQTTKQKRKLTEEVREIDETMNNKEMLQKEYKKRNQRLPLEEKIFSIRILSKMMAEERNKKIQELEQLNDILKPQKFVKYKKELEEKEKYLVILDTKEIEKEIDKLKLELQKIFLKCFETKIDKCETKAEMTKLIYEFRYYCLLPYDNKNTICERKELAKQIEKIGKKVLQQAHKIKVIQRFSKQEEMDYQLLKGIFQSRSINLEEIQVKLNKEKDKYLIQIFDENNLAENSELQETEPLNKRDLAIRFHKKVKAFY